MQYRKNCGGGGLLWNVEKLVVFFARLMTEKSRCLISSNRRKRVFWYTKTTCLPRMKWGSAPEDQSQGTAILSEFLFKSTVLCFCDVEVLRSCQSLLLSPNRLLFQCRYSGTAVEALVMEVNDVPPPMPVAAAGPLRVGLRLGNGQCYSKGCIEGKWYKRLTTIAYVIQIINVYT